MRLYHTILLLSALIVSINAAFQAVWLEQFSLMHDAMSQFGANWLPTIRLAGEITRLTGEFRRLELLYALSDSEKAMAHTARRMSRQEVRIREAGGRLEKLMHTEPEKRAFAGYQASQAAYLAANKDILKAMSEGRRPEAASRTLASAQAFASARDGLQAIESIDQEFGEQATQEAGRQYERVVRTMIASGGAGLLVALAASLFAARRISRPISRLAECMERQETAHISCHLPDPRGGVREVGVLYRSFKSLAQKLAASMERLAAMAGTDQLTGLSNRRALAEEGAKLLDICGRGNQPCSVMMLDIDHFKAVNDSHGHAVGDAVLRHVAQVMREHVRGSDFLARYGGEEFVLLAPNSGLADSVLLAERLRAAIQESVVEAGGQRLRVTVSIGLSGGYPATGDLDGLLNRADEALYRAKRNGRNRVESEDKAG